MPGVVDGLGYTSATEHSVQAGIVSAHARSLRVPDITPYRRVLETPFEEEANAKWVQRPASRSKWPSARHHNGQVGNQPGSNLEGVYT